MRAPVTIAQVVTELDRHNLMPCIVFRSSRNQCDVDAERAHTNPRLHLPPPHQRDIKVKIQEILHTYDMDADLVFSHPHYKALVTTGIGAHHAGQLLMWRLMLEELMAAGVLRVLVATGTVAAGVDFPARTVVITAHSKRGAEGFNPLTASEFQQMSGRAGRRGKDTVGFCVAAPSAFCDGRVLLKISKQPPEPLVSAYFPSPSTVLNLLRYRTVDGLRFTVERSLAAFIDRREAKKLIEHAEEIAAELPAAAVQFDDTGEDSAEEDPEIAKHLASSMLHKHEKKQAKKARRLKRQADTLQRRQEAMLDTALQGLRELGYLDGSNLSEKGFWAANLCTSLVIELAEIIESGLLQGISLERLVTIVASLSGDHHRQYLTTKTPPLDKETLGKLTEILARVRALHMPGVQDDKAVVPFGAYTVMVWLHAKDWQEFRSLLILSDVAEGDAARLITQTAEHLNQLARLTESHQELALLAEEAKRRVLRPPLTEALNFDGL